MSGTPVNLPQYLAFDDESGQRRYQELLNLILSQWLNSNGFRAPTLTSTQVTALLAMTPTIQTGVYWYNSTVDKMQFKGNLAVQTITSV